MGAVGSCSDVEQAAIDTTSARALLNNDTPRSSSASCAEADGFLPAIADAPKLRTITGGDELAVAAARLSPPDLGGIKYVDLARPFCVFREGLVANPANTVRLGPVVGRVTDTTAVLLCEVEVPCDLIVNLARIASGPEENWRSQMPVAQPSIDSMSFMPEGSVSMCHNMEPGRPYTFYATGLVPGAGYLVVLSNVCTADMQRCMARFRTMPELVESLRLVAVSGHSPQRHSLGEANPWQRIARCGRTAPEVSIVLHVGLCVDVPPASRAAVRKLNGIAEFREGARVELLKSTRQILRNTYAEAWGRHEGLRRVLAETGSHLHVFSPPVEQRLLQKRLEIQDPAQQTRETLAADHELEQLLRVALDVHREYQRVLWSASLPGGAHAVADASVTVPGRQEQRSPGRAEFRMDGGSRDGNSVEEWHFHRYGPVSILMLDTKGGLYADKALGPTALLSARQWVALAEVVRDDDTQVLVIVSDVPLFLMEGDSQDPLFWRSRAEELIRLLEMLFEWKHAQYPTREVIVVSSGDGFGTTGDVCDQQLGLSIPMVVTGPVLGNPCASVDRWVLDGNVPGNDTAKGERDRYSFAHKPLTTQWNFCIIDILCPLDSNGKFEVDVQLVAIPPPAPKQFLAITSGK